MLTVKGAIGHNPRCVLGTQTSCLLLSYYSSRSHGTVCTTTCKGRNYCRPRDPASWQKMAAMPDDCERTATVALPTAASEGFISGELGISAALDAFSTVYELLLTHFKKQTDRQTNKQTYGHARSLYLALRATPTRGKISAVCQMLQRELQQ